MASYRNQGAWQAQDQGAYEYVSSGYTLSCETGSYTLTGAVASLLKTSILIAAIGSYAITGSDATLTKSTGYTLTAESGTVIMSGISTGLFYGRSLSAETGSIQIGESPNICVLGPGDGVAGGPSSDDLSTTGQDLQDRWKLFRWPAGASGSADIFSIKMVGITGDSKVADCAYAIWDDNAGAVGNLKVWGYEYDHTFNANTREYFDLGTVVTNRTITAGNIYWIGFRSSLGADGSAYFERQGSDPFPDATDCEPDGCMKVGKVITNETDYTQTPPSSFDINYAPNYYGWAVWGVSTRLFYDRKIAIDAGSYTLTGSDVTLVYTPAGAYILTADGGTIVISGTVASLLKTHKIPIESGAFSLTGSDASLLFGRKISATSGSITLTGLTASLLHNKKIPVEAGSIIVTGQDIGLYKGRTLVTESGTYILTGADVDLIKTWKIITDSAIYTATGRDASLVWTGFIMPNIVGLSIEMKQPEVSIEMKQPEVSIEMI
jgi:hypothetical protein